MTNQTPHGSPGTFTRAETEEENEAGEKLAHQVYGQLVKHFGLGTSHTFLSWDQLSAPEREKWIAALMDVRQDQAEQTAAHAEGPAKSAQ